MCAHWDSKLHFVSGWFLPNAMQTNMHHNNSGKHGIMASMGGFSPAKCLQPSPMSLENVFNIGHPNQWGCKSWCIFKAFIPAFEFYQNY